MFILEFIKFIFYVIFKNKYIKYPKEYKIYNFKYKFENINKWLNTPNKKYYRICKMCYKKDIHTNIKDDKCNECNIKYTNKLYTFILHPKFNTSEYKIFEEFSFIHVCGYNKPFGIQLTEFTENINELKKISHLFNSNVKIDRLYINEEDICIESTDLHCRLLYVKIFYEYILNIKLLDWFNICFNNIYCKEFFSNYTPIFGNYNNKEWTVYLYEFSPKDCYYKIIE